MAYADERPVVAILRAPLFNASETFVATHALSLARYKPVLVGLEDKGNVPPELRDGLVVARRPLRLKLLGDATDLAARLRPSAPALVHAHFATDGLLALPLARALGVPLVTTLHGFDVSRSRNALLRSGRLTWMLYALGRARLQREGRLFVAVSDAIRRVALAQGFPAARTVTLHNGVDLSRFAAGSPEPGLILHVGRLVEKKGTALLIRAFAALAARHPQARLVIVGDGPLRPRLQAMAGERVQFTGAQAPAELAQWLGRAWLLAAPSLTAADGDAEGLPTVVLEAAAAGVPAVVSHHSGLPEAVADGETGLVVPEGDASALAPALDALLSSPDLRARMGHAARHRAQTMFDAGKQAEALERLYDEVTSGAR
jgi:colanic acid/amylovoran biosynthesis glycosyltransferase